MYETYGKRLFDAASAAVALALLSPFLAVVAAAIWCCDGRPLLFAQRRVGRDESLFTILKFRTFPVGTPELATADAGALRPTRLGMVLRRLNLDELPQLVNILKGDMSFVGPRPGLATQTTQLRIRRENGAARLRPGLTGLAQLRGRNGMSEAEKAANDGEYQANVSFASDLAIILRTAVYVVRRPPVY